uniref:hypothetical protein n=1 Tax=Parabacteroides distasonis TaxID=823 RepID=UPI0040294C8B
GRFLLRRHPKYLATNRNQQNNSSHFVFMLSEYIRRECKYLYRIGEQIRELIYYEYIRGNTDKKPRDYETKNMYAYV